MEEDLVTTLQEDGWSLGALQSYKQEQDYISVQAHSSLKTQAKADKGKIYCFYSNEEVTDDFEKKDVLETRPSVVLFKNVKS